MKLREAEAELRTVSFGKDRYDALWFPCPICGEGRDRHWHIVPFVVGAKQHGRGEHTFVWANPGGSMLDDLTLAPSYLAETGRCRVHLFIQNGELKLLPDSKKKELP